jgi:hypothetical protein
LEYTKKTGKTWKETEEERLWEEEVADFLFIDPQEW